jgi:predicted transcriptional regulator
MEIQQIMSTPAYTVKTTDTVQFASEMMALHDVGALPVTEDGVLVGIITDRDIVIRCLAPGRSPTATEASEIMTAGPIALGLEEPVGHAARIFSDMRIRRMPIIQERHPVGMLTVDDIARNWDEDEKVLLMVRRVAPRRKQRRAAS